MGILIPFCLLLILPEPCPAPPLPTRTAPASDAAPEEPSVNTSSSATQAIFTSIQALVTRGDEVILLDPCYDCCELPVTLVGAHPVHVPLNQESFLS